MPDSYYVSCIRNTDAWNRQQHETRRWIGDRYVTFTDSDVCCIYDVGVTNIVSVVVRFGTSLKHGIELKEKKRIKYRYPLSLLYGGQVNKYRRKIRGEKEEEVNARLNLVNINKNVMFRQPPQVQL